MCKACAKHKEKANLVKIKTIIKIDSRKSNQEVKPNEMPSHMCNSVTSCRPV